jgi:class III poly(R)-hydroxyalkanoic acid synthase PhaE subunit
MMGQDKREEVGSATMIDAWMKATGDYWNSVSKMWPAPPEAMKSSASSAKDDKSRVQESVESALRMFHTLSSFVREPNAMDSLYRGLGVLPEIIMKMTQTGWERYFRLNEQWLEKAGKIGQKTEAYKFENIDGNLFDVWTEIYEEEFKRFLNIPQLGLTRFYQERMGRFVDKTNLFQAAMAKFMYLLYLPMEKSFRVMQQKIDEASKEGKVPESSQDVYRIWLKILEGHYMTLFKSPEYTEVLANTLDAVEEFVVARSEFFQDILQVLPVPTHKDMDDIYKELYELKKKVKRLEKKDVREEREVS